MIGLILLQHGVTSTTGFCAHTSTFHAREQLSCKAPFSPLRSVQRGCVRWYLVWVSSAQLLQILVRPEDKTSTQPDVLDIPDGFALYNDLEEDAGPGNVSFGRITSATDDVKRTHRDDAPISSFEARDNYDVEGPIDFSITPGAFRADPGHGLVPAFEEDLDHPPSQDLQPRDARAKSLPQGLSRSLNEVIVVDAALVESNHSSRSGGRRHRKLARAELYRPESRRQRLAFFASFSVFGALAIGIGLGLALRTSDTISPETPTPAPTMDAIRSGWIEQYNLFPSTLTALQEPDSAQTQALTWVTENVLNDAGSNVTIERGKQRFALASLFFALNGPSSLLSDTWLHHGLHECNWTGVACSSETVRALRLSGTQRLQGYVAPEIGLLPSLTSLSIDHIATVNGGIPTEVGHNQQLTSLRLHVNGLAGRIPTELGRLRVLVALDLSKNHLTGAIPTELSAFSSLQFLKLHDNALAGPVPSVSNMQALRILNLYRNLLVGTVPVDLADLPNLESVHLATNRLTGPIPASLGHSPNLSYIALRDNPLTGTVPSELGNLSTLDTLRLDAATLTGAVPTELFGLPKLRVLHLNDNHLSGSIPPHIGNLTSAATLRLSGNRFTGSIPTAWSALSDLRELLLSDNYFSGSVPSELATLSSLKVLLLEHNPSLTGNIPPELCQLANANGVHLSVDCERMQFNASCPCLSCQCVVDLFDP